MKKLLATFFLLSSMSTFATSSSDKASLITLQLTLENTHESILGLTDEASLLAEKQSQLNRLSLIKRGKISKENCVSIRATVSTHLIMVASALEGSKGALDRLKVSAQQEEAIENSLQGFIKTSKEAIDNCGDIPMTIVILQDNSNSLENVLDVFKKLPAFKI